MHYYSTNNRSLQVDFKEATIMGQPADRGLFFPDSIPQLPADFIEKLDSYAKEEIAFRVILPYIGNTIPEEALRNIVAETINFDFPLVPVTESVATLELFHGPTLAFKDVGARFMSRCLSYFAKDNNRKTTVLVATSGDTGGAVANAFHGVKDVEVVILYPSGKVSSIQELQLTTLGKNITALEIEGSFDDCQQMVKQAFADKDLNKKMFLTSANSINIARWLPQQFYYFFALGQWPDKKNAPVISVPSGNFGNICAGLLARRSGLPVRHFIAACNANDVVPAYFENGKYVPKPAVATLSNAMDVGDPSNFVRMLHLFNEPAVLQELLTAYSISDQQTTETIRELYTNEKYLADPHGAVGYRALQLYQQHRPEQKGFFLETAHPIKFYDVVEPLLGKKLELPQSIQYLLSEKKKAVQMRAEAAELKEWLLGKS